MPDKHVMELQIAVAIMDCLAVDKRYKRWLDTYREGLGGMLGVYQLVIDFAQLAVEREIEHDVLDMMYELSEDLADCILTDHTLGRDELTRIILKRLKGDGMPIALPPKAGDKKTVFEVSRVHYALGDIVERCQRRTCKESHMWSVYLRAPDGHGGTKAEWLSDHLTDELANVAAKAYGPLF